MNRFMSFDRFLTLWLVKVVWGIAFAVGALTLIGSIVYVFVNDDKISALYVPLIVIGSLLILRIWLELVVVLFKIADNTSVIAQQPRLPSITEVMPQRAEAVPQGPAGWTNGPHS